MKKMLTILALLMSFALTMTCQQGVQQVVREDVKTTTMGVVKYGNMYFFSGITGPNADNSYPKGMTEQMTNLMEKYKTALSELGMTFDNIIKANVYITDIKLKPEMNKVYGPYFKEKHPMRVCVVVGLEGDAVVEMDAIAIK